MKFQLKVLAFFFFIITITTIAGKSLRKNEHTKSRVHRTIRVGDLQKRNGRNKFVSFDSNRKFLTTLAKNSLIENYVDEVFSWLATVEKHDSAGKRGSFKQFLKLEMRWARTEYLFFWSQFNGLVFEFKFMLSVRVWLVLLK